MTTTWNSYLAFGFIAASKEPLELCEFCMDAEYIYMFICFVQNISYKPTITNMAKM
jgi:hypothetical protein